MMIISLLAMSALELVHGFVVTTTLPQFYGWDVGFMVIGALGLIFGAMGFVDWISERF